MRTRHKSYSDYGFKEGEAKQLKLHCRSPGLSEHDKFLLHQASIQSNPSISELVYKSIVCKLSYEDLQDEDYVPIAKADFYGYQRLCLYWFRQFLMFEQRWN